MSVKIVLVNDTSDQKHPGCELVTENFLKYCKKHDIDVVGRVYHNSLCPDQELKVFEGKYDAILPNGEGTMHDDRPKALTLLEAVRKAPDHITKILFNTVWQNNSDLNEYLQMFSKIYVREPLSKHSVEAGGVSCLAVPDLVLATDTPPCPRDPGSIIVTDGVRNGVSKELFQYAVKHRIEFVAMQERIRRGLAKKVFLKYVLAKKSGRISVCSEAVKLIDKYQNSRLVITGRFHGLCLALAMKKPVVAVASNTHKIQGVMIDVGLGERSVFKSVDELPPPEVILERTDNDRNLLEEYAVNSKHRIDAMFHEIKAVIISEKIYRKIH